MTFLSQSYSGMKYTLSFAPEGRQIASVWNGENQDKLGIHVKAGESRQITFPGPNEIDVYPAFAPNG